MNKLPPPHPFVFLPSLHATAEHIIIMYLLYRLSGRFVVALRQWRIAAQCRRCVMHGRALFTAIFSVQTRATRRWLYRILYTENQPPPGARAYMYLRVSHSSARARAVQYVYSLSRARPLYHQRWRRRRSRVISSSGSSYSGIE